jgi:hypothetical protein
MINQDQPGEFYQMITEARGLIRSSNSEIRQQGVNILQRGVFPRCGSLNGSRKQQDRLKAVPSDILDYLLMRAYMYEIELRDHVAEFVKNQ